jgi:hypothetical protein
MTGTETMGRNLLLWLLAHSADSTASRLAEAVLEGDLEALPILWDRLQETGVSPMQSLKVGQSYLLRSSTYSYIGRVKSVSFTDVVLEEAAVVHYPLHHHDMLRTGELTFVDPYPGEVIVATGAIIDAVAWPHPLPREPKGFATGEDEIPF